MATQEQLRQFHASRQVRDTSRLCYAPWLALNFDQTGSVTACCFNRAFPLGSYPTQNLNDIWQGAAANALREAMLQQRFDLGCQSCERMIEEGNYESVLIRHFDDYAHYLGNPSSGNSLFGKFFGKKHSDVLPPPRVFEFEISNTCNLECIMCGGNWSSAIRKNREKLPALHLPYDAAFVEQVKAFLPELKRANFLGGEPFLISLYYEIWEAIIAINPGIDVAITSNGTVLNERAKNIIEKLPHCRITLSVDSLQPDTWESIRVNGEYGILKKNLDYLLATKKLVSFSVCPMIQNRMEIPGLITFCRDHHLDIYFNVVYGPLGGKISGIHRNPAQSDSGFIPETSLQALPANELSALIRYYQTFQFEGRHQQQLNHLIAQLNTWLRAKQLQHA